MIFFYYSLKVALLVWTCSVFAQDLDSRPRYRADSMNGAIKDGKTIVELVGNVTIIQDSAEITSNKARQYRDDGKTEFWGDVRFIEGEKWLRADSIVSYEKEKRHNAFGHVAMGEGASQLNARKVTYFQKEKLAIADGNVVITNDENRIRLTCGNAEYLRDKAYAKTKTDPVLVELDSLQIEKLRITSEQIELFDDGKRFKAMDDVHMIRDSIHATCGEAEYFKDDSLMTLKESPVVQHSKDVMKGDVIHLFFNDKHLTKTRVIGNASVTSLADSVSDGKKINSLSGADITLFFHEAELQRALVEGTAISTYHVFEDGEDKGTNTLEGDRITLFTKEKKIQHIIIESTPGFSTGKFMPPDKQITKRTLESDSQRPTAN